MIQQETYKQHISTQFNAELEGVKNHLLEMGGSVERQLNDAIESMVKMNIDDAQLVIDQWMIEKRYAMPYDGGTKVNPVSWRQYYENNRI